MKRLLPAALATVLLSLAACDGVLSFLSPTQTVVIDDHSGQPQPTATPTATPGATPTPVPCLERECKTSADCCPQPDGAPEACAIDPVSGQGKCKA